MTHLAWPCSMLCDDDRISVWSVLLNRWIGQERAARGGNYYNELCRRGKSPCDAQIMLDLPRTFPHNRFFQDRRRRGWRCLRRVLNSFALHNAEIGYCQGFNFIAAFLLLFLPEEVAFWCVFVC